MIWGIQITQTSIPDATEQIALPKLVKIDDAKKTTNAVQRGIAAATSATTAYLDVVRDFYWTYSKPQSREEVPTIFLRERKLKVNALINQLKYSLGFTPGTISDATRKAASLLNDLKTSQPNFYNDIAPIASIIQNGLKATDQAVGAVKTVVDKVNNSFFVDDNETLRASNWLKPYRGLYTSEPTGWEFLFPYFDDKFEQHGNQFSETGQGAGIATGFLTQATETIQGIAEFAGFLSSPQNITYIERAKFFNYPTEGDEISFSFPLINTGSVDYNDVINNWQLIFLLLYNNKPGRISPTTIEQPVIYEVEIPGVKFYPFCYISAIDIKFQGSRRELPIQLPIAQEQVGLNAAGSAVDISQQATTKTINTIVPDAYYVTITLKSLLGNTKNFMYHLIDNGEQTRVGTR